MKKIIYTALLVLATMASFTSCTEEEIAPTAETSDNGGGNGDTEPLR